MGEDAVNVSDEEIMNMIVAASVEIPEGIESIGIKEDKVEIRVSSLHVLTFTKEELVQLSVADLVKRISEWET